MQALLTRFRRALHQIPELDRELPKTIAYIRSVLAPLGCALSAPAPGALCAFFDGGKADAVAFRADMDALPIQEAGPVPYASRHPGRMHACGHDGHMALALALGCSMGERLARLPHNLLLIFQPAEETTGGAEAICQSGVLEQYRVRRVFGCHLWPGLPAGQAFARPGPMLARSSEATLTLSGKSAHIARASQGADALYAGAAFVTEAYALMERLLPPEEPRLLKFGRMESGQARNALSGRTVLEGSLRVFSEAAFETCAAALQGLASRVAAGTGCQAELAFSPGYPPLLNDPALFAQVQTALGAPLSPLGEPGMATDDFSFFAKARPALFFFLGTGADAPALHSQAFDFDEEVLGAGLALYQRLAALA